MLAVGAYHADTGLTILYGLLVGLPTAALAGPVYAAWIARRVALPAENPIARQLEGDSAPDAPSFVISLVTVLIPVFLMIGASVADVTLAAASPVRATLDFIGNPIVALLLALLFSFWSLGRSPHFTAEQVLKLCNDCLALHGDDPARDRRRGWLQPGASSEWRGTSYRGRGDRRAR